MLRLNEKIIKPTYFTLREIDKIKLQFKKVLLNTLTLFSRIILYISKPSSAYTHFTNKQSRTLYQPQNWYERKQLSRKQSIFKTKSAVPSRVVEINLFPTCLFLGFTVRL